jgi:hypothetical protein
MTAAEPATLQSSSTAGEYRAFYHAVMNRLNECQIPFLLGGGHALKYYTGLTRQLKDLDIFIKRSQLKRAFAALTGAGYRTELTFPHWLGKVYCGDQVVDMLFSSGNGICTVDDDWFKHSVAGIWFNLPVSLCPLEEMIWCKAFVMERERYDGADIAHIFRACGGNIDWQRLLRRFDAHWRVLLSCLILFGYIYPSDHSSIPEWVLQSLLTGLQDEKGLPPSRNRVCRGTLLSRVQYRDDVESWGYVDARQLPAGPLTPQQAARWTAAASDQAK